MRGSARSMGLMGHFRACDVPREQGRAHVKDRGSEGASRETARARDHGSSWLQGKGFAQPVARN